MIPLTNQIISHHDCTADSQQFKWSCNYFPLRKKGLPVKWYEIFHHFNQEIQQFQWWKTVTFYNILSQFFPNDQPKFPGQALSRPVWEISVTHGCGYTTCDTSYGINTLASTWKSSNLRSSSRLQTSLQLWSNTMMSKSCQKVVYIYLVNLSIFGFS